jgi:hypothetical protein
MSCNFQFYSPQATQHPGREEYFKRHHHFPGHYDLFREEGMLPLSLGYVYHYVHASLIITGHFCDAGTI